eukprot:Blabericola_migrator_1__9390@NODE_506_length_7963_cov_38_720618_g388_i0_p1_GENE_NODE_506_length_7963_cov_38_720618_g388_i0NODE_506_length_7963_cov_38_720618_g388_i0_p1_ORF_typecomplete_len454_score53_91_NODE_506_length_7963_cov_38_720618_g388_i045895950
MALPTAIGWLLCVHANNVLGISELAPSNQSLSGSQLRLQPPYQPQLPQAEPKAYDPGNTNLGQWLFDSIQSIADTTSKIVTSFLPLPQKLEGFTLYETREYWHANGIPTELADRAVLALQASGVTTVSTQHVAKLNEALFMAAAILDAYQEALQEQYHKLSARDFDLFIYHSQIEVDRRIRELFTPLNAHVLHAPHPCHIANTVFDHIVRAMCAPFVVFETCRRVVELPHLDHHHMATHEMNKDHWIKHHAHLMPTLPHVGGSPLHLQPPASAPGDYKLPSHQQPLLPTHQQPLLPTNQQPLLPTHQHPLLPTHQQPDFSQPGIQQPVYTQPPFQQPTYHTPEYGAPTYQAPAYQPPAYQPPAYQAPAYQGPAYQGPPYHSPGMPLPPVPSQNMDRPYADPYNPPELDESDGSHQHKAKNRYRNHPHLSTASRALGPQRLTTLIVLIFALAFS